MYFPGYLYGEISTNGPVYRLAALFPGRRLLFLLLCADRSQVTRSQGESTRQEADRSLCADSLVITDAGTTVVARWGGYSEYRFQSLNCEALVSGAENFNLLTPRNPV